MLGLWFNQFLSELSNYLCDWVKVRAKKTITYLDFGNWYLWDIPVQLHNQDVKTQILFRKNNLKRAIFKIAHYTSLITHTQNLYPNPKNSTAFTQGYLSPDIM